MSDRSLWYPVWIADGRKAGGWSWGPLCNTREQATEHLAGEMIERGHSLGCVVCAGGGELWPVRELVVPAEARQVCVWWDRLEDVCEGLDGSGATRWWPVWMAGDEWQWGEPAATPGAARDIIRERRDAGAPISTLIIADGTERRAVWQEIIPQRARKIVRRWDELWDATDPESARGRESEATR
jgi:hypothetical protein